MKLKLLILWVMLSIFSFGQLPKPNFNFTYSIGNNQEIILQLQNHSQGEDLNYEWHFPGAVDTFSTNTHPEVVYNEIGEYTIKLKVANAQGESFLEKKIVVSGDADSHIINLSTGMNDDGSTMSSQNVTDTNWTVTNPNGVTGNPQTRSAYTGWSTAVLSANPMFNHKTVWIRSGNLYGGSGDYFYKSKTFDIPTNVENAMLSLRALAFVRNWTYLIRINEDGSETEVTELSRTLWLSDGAKGWLNSRTTVTEDYPLLPGKYYIKARVYTNNTNLNDALNINGLVSIGNSIRVESIDLPILNLNKTVICNGSTQTLSIAELNNLDNTHTYEWKLSSDQQVLASSLKSPTFTFTANGTYSVELKVSRGNLHNAYTFTNQILVEACGEVVDPNVLAAPNSYIYDIDLAKSNHHGGILIPVKKAYDVWQDQYGLINQKIPNLAQSGSVVWQDKEDLIQSVTMVGTGENAKLKVEVNPTKGKGNAVVAFHVGENSNDSDPIYWSWHIWVTDDPTNGITYVNNGDARMVNIFMDRNLGALNDSFLGYDWNKSGGLLYQWGRKDPFPPLFYLDGSRADFYTKSKRILNIEEFSNAYVVNRMYDLIDENLIYSLNNPLNFINRTENAGTWFASSVNNKKRVDENGYAIENYDLWGDNNRGVTKQEGFEKQVKSPYDPCPAGWRVPSFAHSDSTIPNFSPWGNSNGYSINDNPNYSFSEINNRFPDAKFYPAMGVDFKEGSDHYNLGLYPSTGAYKLINGRLSFQDTTSETAVWSATLDQQVHGRFLKIINDPLNGQGVYTLNTSITTPTSEGLAVRCVKDQETLLSFDTEYFTTDKRNYTDGLDNPNSYILYENREVSIPVNKAYAVYNQVLTDREWIPNGQQTVNVYWTTNQNLIETTTLTGTVENAKINVKLKPNQYGNAVVSLHVGDLGNSNDPVYWSWHIWVPKENPEENFTEYITDNSNQMSSFKVFSTETGFPPLKTEFMNMPLGALKKFNTPAEYAAGDGYSFHYQWGRKDPIPSFYDGGWGTTFSVYTGSNNGSQVSYSMIENNNQYVSKGYQQKDKQNQLSAKEVLKFSIHNPLTFLYNTQTSNSDWLTNQPLYMTDRWGHASKKSIYDPCPEGWRVPDFGHNTPLGSPWGNANRKKRINNDGFDQWDLSTVFNDYNIAYNGRNNNNGQLAITRAYFYKNTDYNLGFHLPSQGFRGINTKGAVGVFDNNLSSTVWSSTITSNIKGYGMNMDTNTFTNWHSPSNLNKLNNAFNVVCSKDTPRFSFDQFNSFGGRNYGGIVSSYIDQIDEINNEIVFYPNPVNDILRTNYIGILKIDIYSVSGEKVFSGQFQNQQLNLSNIESGIYIIVLENGDSYKIIKK